MKDYKGITLVSLVVSIIIILIMAGVAINMLVGDNGIIARALSVEQSQNKGDVLEELNVMIEEKYLDAYKRATQMLPETHQLDLDPFYNGEKVIKFLQGWSGGPTGDQYGASVPKDKPVIIEELLDPIVANRAQLEGEQTYFIILKMLNRKIAKYGKGENGSPSDYFYIQGAGNTYTVYYRNLDGESENLGNLQIQQTI